MGEAPQAVTITDEDQAQARRAVKEASRGAIPAAIVLIGITNFLGALLATLVLPESSVWVRACVGAGLTLAFALPIMLLIAWTAKGNTIEQGARNTAQERKMRADAARREFQSQLGRALEMSEDEPAAFDVIRRAIVHVAPEAPVELLLADNSHAHLERMVVASPDGTTEPGCTVDSPDRCVAGRRAQTQVFPNSEDLDACPMLRGREHGRCSGVCVPVSIMGRTVGVIHATGPVDEPLETPTIQALQTLANQAGNRLGMLRVMAETQLQAATDGLTGLINRRSLENRMRRLRADGVDFALVMADLDLFKALNDAHGHEAGDRALRVFSETLRRELRTDDLACRYGGEEFVIVLPGTDAHGAVEMVERVRDALVRATAHGLGPAFTASFGVAESTEAASVDDLVQRADHALFAAKQAGRDRICIEGHATPVAPTLTALG